MKIRQAAQRLLKTKISTGIPFFDQAIGGGFPKGLTLIIGARPHKIRSLLVKNKKVNIMSPDDVLDDRYVNVMASGEANLTFKWAKFANIIISCNYVGLNQYNLIIIKNRFNPHNRSSVMIDVSPWYHGFLIVPNSERSYET